MDVNKQNHYTNFKIQHMEFAEVNGLSWCEGNITKYVCRWRHKNGVEDLKKAASYLKCLLYYAETGKFSTPDKLEAQGYKI